MATFTLDGFDFSVHTDPTDIWLTVRGTDGNDHIVVFLENEADKNDTFSFSGFDGSPIAVMSGETLWNAWDIAAEITDTTIRY